MQYDAMLPVLDCRGAFIEMFDANNTRTLFFGPDYCVNWGGGSTLQFSTNSGDGQKSWSGDASWHTCAVKFKGGVYNLYQDGTLVSTTSGPARLRAASFRLGGWEHALPGTRFDDLKIGP